jgi:hypothetical protein
MKYVNEIAIKPIKIVKENAKAIEDALRQVNGRAHDYTFDRYSEIEELANTAEERLSDMLGSVKRYAGARYRCQSGCVVANAYKHTRKGTYVELLRRTTGWYLTLVATAVLFTNSRHREILVLTPEQDKEARDLFFRKYRVEALPEEKADDAA